LGDAVPLLVPSGSPRAFSPRDDKVCGEWHGRFGYNAHFVIARRERSEGRGNPSCLEGRRSGVAVRLLVPSGSPRASPARWQDW